MRLDNGTRTHKQTDLEYGDRHSQRVIFLGISLYQFAYV